MNNIKTARVTAGLSRKEISITLGVSSPTVSDWENGKKFPSGKNLIKLAQILHTSTDFLLGCCETEKIPPPKEEDELSRLDPLDKRLNELLSQATEEMKQAMIVLLEQSQRH